MAIANAGDEQRQSMLEDARRRGLAQTEEELDALLNEMLAQVKRGEARVTMDHIVTAGLAAMGAEHVIPIIEQMAWMVIEAPPGREFIISDNPVVLFSPTATGILGVGYLTRDVEVTMPLSRQHLLFLSHEPWYAGRCCVVEAVVDEANRRIWAAAQDYVFASSQETLQAAAEMVPPDIRRKPGGGIKITGG